jgi:hypothetical protein
MGCQKQVRRGGIRRLEKGCAKEIVLRKVEWAQCLGSQASSQYRWCRRVRIRGSRAANDAHGSGWSNGLMQSVFILFPHSGPKYREGADRPRKGSFKVWTARLLGKRVSSKDVVGAEREACRRGFPQPLLGKRRRRMRGVRRSRNGPRRCGSAVVHGQGPEQFLFVWFQTAIRFAHASEPHSGVAQAVLRESSPDSISQPPPISRRTRRATCAERLSLRLEVVPSRMTCQPEQVAGPARVDGRMLGAIRRCRYNSARVRL